MKEQFFTNQKQVDDLITKCAAVNNISVERMMIKSRKREIVSSRQLAMYYLCKHTKMTLAQIGGLLGGKDHATVLHAEKTITSLLETDSFIRSKAKEIEFFISGLLSGDQNQENEQEEKPLPVIEYQSMKTVRQIRDSKLYKSLSEERMTKIRILEQQLYEQDKRIKILESNIVAAEAQARLFKRKMEYAQMPSRILAGE